eukprot:1145772-Pelagomonas_calceolata.AAC.4
MMQHHWASTVRNLLWSLAGPPNSVERWARSLWPCNCILFVDGRGLNASIEKRASASDHIACLRTALSPAFSNLYYSCSTTSRADGHK